MGRHPSGAVTVESHEQRLLINANRWQASLPSTTENTPPCDGVFFVKSSQSFKSKLHAGRSFVKSCGLPDSCVDMMIVADEIGRAAFEPRRKFKAFDVIKGNTAKLAIDLT